MLLQEPNGQTQQSLDQTSESTEIAKAVDSYCSVFAASHTEVHVYDCEPDLSSYEEFIVFFSGGKDSIATVLHLLELGVDPASIEIHHHLVDGKEGSSLMDWPVTESYVQKFAEAFGMRFVLTWRIGGFEAEMLRDNSPTAPVMIPHENGGFVAIGGKGSTGTRRKFPQVSNSLSTRWCSAYLKCDVAARYLANTPRFQDGKRRLIITGERAEESPGRATYAKFLVHAQDKRNGKKTQRYLDHWRPVHRGPESQVWAIMERHSVNPHPAYKIGYSRCSCAGCIFINDDSWATLKFMAPPRFQKISNYESEFGVTIHRTESVEQRANKGTVMPDAARYGPIALYSEYLEPILVSNWELPAGAYKSNGGRF